MNMADVTKWLVGGKEVLRVSTKTGDLIPTATDTDGTIFYDKGYAKSLAGASPHYRISLSVGDFRIRTDVSNGGSIATGFIPAKAGDIIHVYGMAINGGSSQNGIVVYDKDKQYLGGQNSNGNNTYGIGAYTSNQKIHDSNQTSTFYDDGMFTIVDNPNIAFVRFTSIGVNSGNAPLDELTPYIFVERPMWEKP